MRPCIALLAVILIGLGGLPANAESFQKVGPETTYDAGLRCSVPRWQVADLNRDGRPDFVIGATPTSAYSAVSLPGEIMMWIAQPDGSFQERARQLFGGNVTAAYLYSNIRIADLNGDGIPDILAPDAGIDTYVNGVPTGPWLGATPKLALSGGGGYSDASSRFGDLPKSFAHSAEIADIDNNGKFDIYVGSITASPSSRMPYLLLNDGKANFTYDQSRLPGIVVTSGSAPVTSIDANTRTWSSQQYTGSLFVDINRDGAVDLVLFPVETVPNGLVLINDGTGKFSQSAPIDLPPGLYGGGKSLVRTNPGGTLTFGQTPGAATVGLDAKAVDLNGDGYPDIVVVETQTDQTNNIFYRGGKLQILINQQGRGFVDESTERGAPGYVATQNYDSYHGELTIFDINGDGHPDLIGMRVTPTGYYPDIFLNDGTGKFARATIDGLPTQGFIVPLYGGPNQSIRVASVKVVYRGGGATPLACNMVVQTHEKAASPSPNFTALFWNPAESGWGVNLNHQGNTLFGTLFTYDTNRTPLWLVMSAGAMQSDGLTFTGDLYRTTGPAFNANPFTPIGAANLNRVGAMTVSFIDVNRGALRYTLNGAEVTKAIQRQVYGTRAASCLPTTASRATATNYQDLWWNAAESGWGINITHQDNTLFATLFTYDATGKTLWLVMSSGQRQADGSYLGDLFQTAGPAFNTNPFTGVTVATVGTMRLRFSDGNNGTLTYTYNGTTVIKAITRQLFSTPVPVCN